MGSSNNSYCPDWLVRVAREPPVSVSVAVTDADGTAAPEGSVTLPDRFAETWACAERKQRASRARRTAEKRSRANDILIPIRFETLEDWIQEPSEPRFRQDQPKGRNQN